MIECRNYNLTMMTPETCIARQEKLVLILGRNATKPGYRKNAIQEDMKTSDYYQIRLCHGCEQGQTFYQDHKKGILNIEQIGGVGMDTNRATKTHERGKKTCQECKAEYPATLEFFGKANRSADGLTKNCLKCRKIDDVVEALSNKANNATTPDVNGCEAAVNGAATSDQVLSKCSACGRIFPKTDEFFHRDGARADGFVTACKACRNEQKGKIRKANSAAIKKLKASPAFDPGTAKDIAEDVLNRIMIPIQAFERDQSVIEKIRAVAIQVGIESQRRMSGAA